jgi:hypothetical protein
MEMPKKVRAKADLKPCAIHDFQAAQRLIAHFGELGAHPAGSRPALASSSSALTMTVVGTT